MKFNRDVAVVFSSEQPITKSKGSYVGVTGSFGLACSSYIIRKALER